MTSAMDTDIETPGTEGGISAPTEQDMETEVEAPVMEAAPEDASQEASQEEAAAPAQREREPRPERDGATGGSTADVSMKSLLEAGVHFGHQTKRWNPKMRPYIFGARSGIYIVDLQKTAALFDDAY